MNPDNLIFVEALRNGNSGEERVVFKTSDDPRDPYFVVKTFDQYDQFYSVKWYPHFSKHLEMKSYWRTVIVLHDEDERKAHNRAIDILAKYFNYHNPKLEDFRCIRGPLELNDCPYGNCQFKQGEVCPKGFYVQSRVIHNDRWYNSRHLLITMFDDKKGMV